MGILTKRVLLNLTGFVIDFEKTLIYAKNAKQYGISGLAVVKLFS